MRDHRKLRAFKLADALAMMVYRLTRSFPRDEQFGLTAQMRRGAVSIASNIVEGCARSTHTEYVRFLDMAYGSACEVQYQASLAHRLEYLADGAYASLRDHCAETSKVLNALIRSLRRQQ
ncbi:MAG: four helix bundle protein [Planctomycetes bacterium]|nr:four helix bundle protein [Planctomycetota bacterium]